LDCYSSKKDTHLSISITKRSDHDLSEGSYMMFSF